MALPSMFTPDGLFDYFLGLLVALIAGGLLFVVFVGFDAIP